MSRVLLSTMSALHADGARVEEFVCDGGRIAAHDGCMTAPPEITIDADGLTAVPGLIDCQVNGGHQIDLASDPAAMWALGELLPRYGVTAFLPTLISGPADTASRGMAALRQRPLGYQGAEPLGLHLEGPMLNPEYRGAHPKDHLALPSPQLVSRWSRSAGVTMVTLAPELPGVLDVVGTLRGRGVVVAAGHSGATADQAMAGVDAGVSAVTHVFNTMAPLHHRKPNLVTVALTNPTLTVGLIADGIHVDPLVVDLVWRAKGPDRVALVSDAVTAMGEAGGCFSLGGDAISAGPDGVRTRSGKLAGSALTLIDAVRNLIAFTSASKSEALRAASATPATLIGATGRGGLDVGCVADVVLVDERVEVCVTLCRGELSYVAPGHEWRIAGDVGEVGW